MILRPRTRMEEHVLELMLIRAQRLAVVQEARSWLGTPFHHDARVKGAGVDCMRMPCESYNQAIYANIDVPANSYDAQWHLHQTGIDSNGNRVFRELYLEGLLKAGFVEVSDHQSDFEPFDPNLAVDAAKDTGDMAVVKLARTYSHGAIIVHWPQIIQTESSPCGRGMVVETNADANWFFTARPIRFFSRREWHGLAPVTQPFPIGVTGQREAT